MNSDRMLEAHRLAAADSPVKLNLLSVFVFSSANLPPVEIIRSRKLQETILKNKQLLKQLLPLFILIKWFRHSFPPYFLKRLQKTSLAFLVTAITKVAENFQFQAFKQIADLAVAMVELLLRTLLDA